VSERVSTILERVDDLNSRTIDFVASLTGPQLRTPCEDPECATVGDVVQHLVEGSKQVMGWAAATLGDPPATATTSADTAEQHGHDHGHDHDHDHGHSHGPVDTVAAIEVMRAAWTASVKMIGNLTDAQLDSVPASTQGIADGSVTLNQILNRMMDHQEQHLTYMTTALEKAGAK
jgi:hypothetical protein